MVSHIGACGATFQRSKPFHTILQPTSTLVDPRSTFIGVTVVIGLEQVIKLIMNCCLQCHIFK